jgi:negative regulator of sigma E activity
MNDFQHIGKRMPYRESSDYVSQLVNRATENALHQQNAPKAKRTTLYLRLMAAAAMVLLVVGIGITYYQQAQTVEPQLAATTTSTTATTTGPIDHFLASLTDDEAQQLTYYEIDEIPEEY